MLELLKSLIIKVKDITYKLGLISDYVVEWGTSGIWIYRKWNSGIAECWRYAFWEQVPYAGTYLDEYQYLIGDVYFPFAFIDAPVANVTGKAGTGYGSVTFAATTKTYITIYVSSNQSPNDNNSNSAYAYIDIKGKWK